MLVKECVYPNPIKHNKKFDKYIKCDFKNKLLDKLYYVDYGICFIIHYDGFWFSIKKNYKIDIIIENCNVDEKIIDTKLKDVMKLITRFYPDIYT